MTYSINSSPNRRRRRRLVWVSFLLAAALILIGWGVYKGSVGRPADVTMPVDTGCGTDPSSAADLATVTADGPVVDCVPWDIGTGVAGYSWNAPEPRGIVLFQHGWADYTQRWVTGADDFIPALLMNGFSVHGLDMWGNGHSGGVRGAVDVKGAVADHLAARDVLEKEGLPIYVVGHSLGGLVTATSVLDDQSDIAGVILLAPAVKYDTTPLIRAVTAVVSFVVPTVAAPSTGNDDAELVGVDALTSISRVAEELTADPLIYDGPVPWITADGGARVSHDNWSRYPEMIAPVLALHGDQDESTDPTGSRELIAGVSSPDKEFVSLAGIRHSILDDVRADESRQIILDWLDERTPPTTAE